MTHISGIDLARSLALLGMLIVNYVISMNASENGSEWLVFGVGLLSGKAAALFVTLAGVGLAIMANKTQSEDMNNKNTKKSLRIKLLKRSGFLFLVGLVYIPLWPADILHYYGIYITIGVLFLFVSQRYLWVAIAVSIISFHVLLFTLNYDMGWNWETLEYAGFWTLEGFARNLFFNGFHPVLPWVSFLLIGMWAGRHNLADSNIRKKLLLKGIIVFVIFQSLSFFLLLDETDEELIFLAGTEPIPPTIFYMGVAGSLSVIIIILCIEFSEKWKNSIFLRWLNPLGQLAHPTIPFQ